MNDTVTVYLSDLREVLRWITARGEGLHIAPCGCQQCRAHRTPIIERLQAQVANADAQAQPPLIPHEREAQPQQIGLAL